jgi:hypothetical protein
VILLSNAAIRKVHEIHLFVCFLDVVGHKPGDRLHFIIPWISGQIGVAVKTSTFEDRGDLLRYRVFGVDGIPDPSFIVFHRMYKLDQYEYNTQGNQDFL